ncbi:MAG: hypothetical protein U9R17_04475 [Thermodesulfobacteriota bacterium]|nr:hypothetical protein [Thermodesulfobacteriota bacterium]
MDPRNARKEYGACHIIAEHHLSDLPVITVIQDRQADLWGCGSSWSSLQNAYKIAYGDENTTFEPVNGYNIQHGLCPMSRVTPFWSIRDGD